MSPPSCVIVSGGSRGLGAAITEDLLANGHNVCTFSRSASAATKALGERYPGNYLWQAVDGSDPAATRAFVHAVIQRFGRLDGLINNAGLLHEGLLALARDSDIHRVIALNLEGTIYLTRSCVRAMLGGQNGSIINISSLNGVRGHGGVAVYSATKAALDGLSRSLARELGPRGIRVNSVAPGYFESEMTEGLGDKQKAQILRRTPLGRLGHTNDLVGVLRFLLSADARFITGQTLVVDGGLTC